MEVPRAVDELQLRRNLHAILVYRTVTSGAAGAVAGILGLTGWAGLVLFLVVMVAASGLLFLRTGLQPSKFLRSPTSVFLLADDAFGSALLFVLMWTMLYAVVYLY